MRDESSIPDPSAAPTQDHAWPDRASLPADVAVPYGEMIDALRDFLDKVSGARPDLATLAQLTHDLEAWSGRLEACAVDERDQLFARLLDQPGRGQTMSPALVVETQEIGDFRGHVTFGRYFLGVNGAVHGGTLPLLFDEVLGRAGRRPGLRLRTAYLKTDFRALTPLDTRLQVHGLARPAGRPQVLRPCRAPAWRRGLRRRRGPVRRAEAGPALRAWGPAAANLRNPPPASAGR